MPTVQTPRAFISFDFDNNESAKHLFVGQSRNSQTPFDISDWSSKEALPQRTWEDTIRAKINRTNMVIVLVGKNMGTAIGVAKEIAMAKAQNVPVFGVYVGGADANSTLPVGLTRGQVISWNWDTIAAAIRQMMGEGKNAL